MFKVAGATVYPSEVEQVLREIPGVAMAFVTNITTVHGDRVAAALVCDTAALTVENLRASARRVLSSFKVPTVWLLSNSDEAIPRRASGKIDTGRLRALLAAEGRPAPADSQPAGTPQRSE